MTLPDGVTSEDVVAGGAAVGVGVGAGAGAFLRGGTGEPATRRAAFSGETPTTSTTDRIDTSRPTNVTVDTTIEDRGRDERELERIAEQIKRDAKEELRREFLDRR